MMMECKHGRLLHVVIYFLHGTHLASHAGDQPWDIPQILPWLASINFPAPVRKKVPPQEFDQNNSLNNSFGRSAVE